MVLYPQIPAGSKFSEDDVEEMIEQGNWSVFTQGVNRNML